MNKEPTNDGRLGFLKAELKTGMTLVSIAADATDKKAIDRNYRNAMKAYESVRHFLPKVPLSGDESIEMHKGIKKLGRRLERLRERISR